MWRPTPSRSSRSFIVQVRTRDQRFHLAPTVGNPATMSHRSHTASSRSSSVIRRRESEEHPTPRRGEGSEEVRRIAAELERDDLALKLAQLQRDFDELRRTTIPISQKTQSPVLDVRPQQQTAAHPLPIYPIGPSIHADQNILGSTLVPNTFPIPPPPPPPPIPQPLPHPSQ